jgi:hypothetical protein
MYLLNVHLYVTERYSIILAGIWQLKNTMETNLGIGHMNKIPFPFCYIFAPKRICLLKQKFDFTIYIVYDTII